MQVAAGMMGGCLGALHCAARMMLFVGGPSTEGGGKVVDKELSEPIRSHKVCPFPSGAQQWREAVWTCHNSSLLKLKMAMGFASARHHVRIVPAAWA